MSAPEQKEPKPPSFGEQVRRAMRKLHPEFPLIDTIRVRPYDTREPAECLCRLTYGEKKRRYGFASFDVEFQESGELTKGYFHKPMTPEHVAEKLFRWVEDRKQRALRQAQQEIEAAARTQRIEAAEAEVPSAIDTKLLASPAINVLGLGTFIIDGIEDDTTEPVFTVSGKLTIAAVKQLLAGTLFHLKLDT